ncbi:MAG: hypothetical protein NWR72_04175 [Bacteroidia bacterium]|nr:hypothetical protein [Bacteroidia bacterium]
MGKRSILLWLIMIAGLGNLLSQRLPVRMADFQIYEKQLEGFEILLPSDAVMLREALVAHLQAQGAAPSVYEDMILCEQLRYAPVSVWQPLTLVYFLEPQTKHLTRFRAAALIDYRESVTVPRFPDLALRLLLDLDQFTRSATGDSLNFDPLFIGIQTQDLVRQYQARKSQQVWNLYVERRPSEVTDQPGLFLRQSTRPIDSLPDTEIDDAIVEEVSRRFRQYLSSDEIKPFLGEESSGLARNYRDSLDLLTQELARTREVRQRLLTERDSLSQAWQGVQSQAGDMPEAVRKRMVALEAENEKLTAQLAATSPLPAVALSVDTLAIISPLLSEHAEERKAFQQQIDRLNQELLAKEQEIGVVFGRMEQLERQGRSVNREEDSLVLQLANWQQQERAWADRLAASERQILVQDNRGDSLLQIVAALNPESDESKARRAIYLRQQEQLQQAQIALTERGWELAMREKRIRQRELFLSELEENTDQEALIRRISELEEQLRLIEIKADEPAKQILIEPAILRIGEADIPAFSVRSQLPASWVREQLRAWARSYGLPISGDEVLQIVSKELPGMEGVRYTWRLSVLQRESGCIIYSTFKGVGESYLDPRERSLESSRATFLLQEVFQ